MTTSTNLPGHPQVPNLSEVPGSILGRDSAVNKVLLRRSAAVRRARYSTIKIWVGAICAGVVIIPVVLARVLPLPDPIVGALSESSLPPFSAGHLLGTDPNGRDLLSRILHGGQTSLVIGMLAIFVSGLVGIVAGAAAGYFGGWVDTIISRLLEAQMALPLLLMLLLVVALFGPSIPVITLVIAFAQWPEPARITRALVLVEREKPYVAAARVLGLPKFAILRRHVVPEHPPAGARRRAPAAGPGRAARERPVVPRRRRPTALPHVGWHHLRRARALRDGQAVARDRAGSRHRTARRRGQPRR